MTLARRADVVVVGAGVAGLSIARELVSRGAEVVVVERAGPLSRTASGSGAAVGRVAFQARLGPEPEPMRDLVLLARQLYAEFVETLEEETGLACEWDVRGGVAAALSDAEEVELDRALDWQRERGLAFEVLEAEEARGREPALGPSLRSAFVFAGDGQISPRRLLRALSEAFVVVGGAFAADETALALRLEAGRAAGVETTAGAVLADVVVNATGAWAGRLPGAPEAPVLVRRAAAVALDASADPDRLRRGVVARDLSLVPTREGGLVAAGAWEDSSFASRPSAGAVAALLARAAVVAPAIARYPLLSSWAGLAPFTPDGVPLLGETAVPGYVLATGWGDSGLTLAPAAAALLADLIGQRPPALSPAPFSPARFDV